MRPNRSHLEKYWSLDPDVTFLNHGSFGATPNMVLEEQNRLRLHLESDPVRFFEREAFENMNFASRKLSTFLNANPEGMTFCQNATSGVNTVLRSLVLNRGDEIIIPNHSYQACWNAIDFVASRWGAKVVVVDLPFRCDSEEEIIEPLLAAISPKTVLAMIDTVTSPTGLRMPFEKLVDEFQSRGVDVLLDAAHGPGIVPMDLAKLDVAWVTGNCHKWLCSPKGSAFLHIREDKKRKLNHSQLVMDTVQIYLLKKNSDSNLIGKELETQLQFCVFLNPLRLSNQWFQEDLMKLLNIIILSL